MRVQHWCMLGVTILLLLCEVTISQLCKSLITLVDGFHTLFILLLMAPPPPQTGSIRNPPPPSLDPSTSPPHGSSCSPAELPSILPAQSPVEPPAGARAQGPPLCGVSFPSGRLQPVGAFISALLLTFLCLTYFMEIISFCLEPHAARRPLLLVAVGAASLLCKLLVVRLNWDQLQKERAKNSWNQSHLEETHTEETKGRAEPTHHSLHRGALVLCNPGTSSVPDTDSHPARQQPFLLLRPAAQRDGELKVRSDDATDDACVGHLDTLTAPSRRRPVGLLAFVLVVQGLCTSLLALVTSLVALLLGPQLLHSSGTVGLLLYMDPALSLLALVMLIATAAPQVYRCGLLLLQATPPHICVSDLGRRITSVPGVQAVHNLHVWQLTDSFAVASVHVHCHAGFPMHRCADLMAGVTKVLQSVGVSCCTVQPEFASCCGSSAGSEGDASPVIHREDPSLPPLLTCSLACGKACAGHLCCSTREEEEEETGPLAPPAGESKEEPQTLVIENTFL